MYAVIKTGGKQYRVKAGDMLVVERLDGKAGAEVSFDQVLMLGEGADVTVGAPLVDGALVKATLVETRKGEKIKIFKKIRRQGYRRTRGHRQMESVLRVTSVAGGGKSEAWDGEVDLTTRAVLNARARGLTNLVAVLEGRAPEKVKAKAAPAKPAPKAAKPASKAKAADVAAPEAVAEAPVEAKAAPKAKAKAEPQTKAKTETKTAEKAPAKAKPAKASAPKAPSKADARAKSGHAAPSRPAPKSARPKGKG